MASTLTCGGTSGIALANLKHIKVFKTSKQVIFEYANGSTATLTGTAGADADDFVANVLPYIGGQAQVDVFPAL